MFSGVDIAHADTCASALVRPTEDSQYQLPDMMYMS